VYDRTWSGNRTVQRCSQKLVFGHVLASHMLAKIRNSPLLAVHEKFGAALSTVFADLVKYRQRRPIFSPDVFIELPLSDSSFEYPLPASGLVSRRSHKSDAELTSHGSDIVDRGCRLHLEVGACPRRTGVAQWV
jgi:hypothetical protein